MNYNYKYLLIIVLLSGSIFSQSLDSLIQQMGNTYVRGYLGPIPTVIGTGMNGGTFHTAKPHKFFGFDFKYNLSIIEINNSAKTFYFYLPTQKVDIPITILSEQKTISLGLDDMFKSKYSVPTIFGDTAAVEIEKNDVKLRDAFITQLASEIGQSENDIETNFSGEIDNALENADIPAFPTFGGFNIPIVPVVVPQFSIGLPFKIELSFRGLPQSYDLDSLGSFSFMGYGGKIGLNQFLPIPFLPKLSAGYYITNLEFGDIIAMNNNIATIQASASIPIITVYGGVGFENTSLNVDYTYEDGETNIPISFNLEGNNKFRSNVGLRIKLLLLSVYADYTLGEYESYNAGFGFTFR